MLHSGHHRKSSIQVKKVTFTECFITDQTDGTIKGQAVTHWFITGLIELLSEVMQIIKEGLYWEHWDVTLDCFMKAETS